VANDGEEFDYEEVIIGHLNHDASEVMKKSKNSSAY
jgi:hypothetical protein